MNLRNVIQNSNYYFVYLLMYCLSLLPLKVLYKFADLFFFIIYYIFKYRKEVVIQNISRSFPQKKYSEIQKLSKDFYKVFTSYFAEIVKSISCTPQKLNERFVFENLELLDNYINSGINVIAATGHCGNWELLSFMSYKIQSDMYGIYKPIKSKVTDQMMIKIRSRFGMKLISNKSIIRHILSKSTKPSIYLFLTDQCPITNDEKYKYTFLNQDTYIFSGMEKLARSKNSAVVYLNVERISNNGKYKISCLPICSESQDMKEGEITLKYVELLSKNIYDNPTGWLWTHKRWKR